MRRTVLFSVIRVICVGGIASGCAGTSLQTVPLPVGDEFIREFGSDGASLEMVGSNLMAGVRDQQAVAMTADGRARRAREMAQWLWIRHGRGIGVERIVVQFISPGETDTILAEHQFSRSELGRRGTPKNLPFPT